MKAIKFYQIKLPYNLFIFLCSFTGIGTVSKKEFCENMSTFSLLDIQYPRKTNPALKNLHMHCYDSLQECRDCISRPKRSPLKKQYSMCHVERRKRKLNCAKIQRLIFGQHDNHKNNHITANRTIISEVDIKYLGLY